MKRLTGLAFLVFAIGCSDDPRDTGPILFEDGLDATHQPDDGTAARDLGAEDSGTTLDGGGDGGDRRADVGVRMRDADAPGEDADGSPGDAGNADSGSVVSDSGRPDTGSAMVDGGGPDIGSVDMGMMTPDSGPADSGMTVMDSGARDMGPPDMGPPDMGPPDMGPPDMGPPDMGSVGGVCPISNPEPFPGPCDPVNNLGCAPSFECVLALQLVGSDVVVTSRCTDDPKYNLPEGANCSGTPDRCAPELFCVSFLGVCTRLCSMDTGEGCFAGEVCIRPSAQWNRIGYCGTSCN